MEFDSILIPDHCLSVYFAHAAWHLTGLRGDACCMTNVSDNM